MDTVAEPALCYATVGSGGGFAAGTTQCDALFDSVLAIPVDAVYYHQMSTTLQSA